MKITMNVEDVALAMAQPSQIEQRLQAVLDGKRGRHSAGRTTIVSALLLTASAVPLLAAAQTGSVVASLIAAPTTSEKAVQNFLNSSPIPDRFGLTTRVGTHSQVKRILAIAVTPANAESGGTQTQKVYYKVEVALSDDYLARRLAYLEYERTQGTHTNQALNQSVKRLRRNRQIVQGTALVKKTPSGWEVLDTRSINNRLDAWALDIYYTG